MGCAVLITGLQGAPVAAQPVEWRVVRAAPIGTPPAGQRHVESWLAVDPTSSDRMLATAIAVGFDTFGSEVYSTDDGGASWTRGEHQSGSAFPGLDPVVAFTRDGIGWFSTIDTDRGGAMRLWRSFDGGLTWTGMPDIPGGVFDRQYLAAGSEPGDPYLVVTAKGLGMSVFGGVPLSPNREFLHVAQTDDGEVWGLARRMMPSPVRRALHAPTGLQLLPDGRVAVPYLAWSLPQSESIPDTIHGHIAVSVSDITGWFRTSVDVGPIAAISNAGADSNPLGMRLGLGVGGVALAPKRAARAGDLYLVWSSLHGGSDYRVYVSSSTDGGSVWSEPLVVDAHHGRGAQSNPAIAVSAFGVVGVVWNDFREDADNACYEVLFATSTDGARSFGEPMRLTEGPTCAAAPIGSVVDHAGLLASGKVDPRSEAFRWVNGGDTQGLVALPDGSFQLALISGSDGVPRLWEMRLQPR